MSNFTPALAGMLLAASLSAASAQSLDSFRQQGRMTCMGDVLMLCAGAVPDEARIITCMRQHRPQLSDACRQVFDAGVKAQRRQQSQL